MKCVGGVELSLDVNSASMQCASLLKKRSLEPKLEPWSCSPVGDNGSHVRMIEHGNIFIITFFTTSKIIVVVVVFNNLNDGLQLYQPGNLQSISPYRYLCFFRGIEVINAALVRSFLKFRY